MLSLAVVIATCDVTVWLLGDSEAAELTAGVITSLYVTDATEALVMTSLSRVDSDDDVIVVMATCDVIVWLLGDGVKAAGLTVVPDGMTGGVLVLLYAPLITSLSRGDVTVDVIIGDVIVPGAVAGPDDVIKSVRQDNATVNCTSTDTSISH